MPRRSAVATLVAIALLVSCAGDTSPPPPSSSPQAGFPVTVDAANGPVELAERPDAIVSISPTATEMLFALGAGDQVVAVDDQSNFPPEAPTTDLSGFEPNVEAIATYEPDLVVTSDDTGELLDSLAALDIPVMAQPAAVTLDDTYEQIGELGQATGHVEDAADVVESMRGEIDDIVASVPAFATPPTYYHELDPTYFTATSSTFIGELYTLVGLRNIADPADDGSGYPQLSAEFIVDADPDLIFLADTKCCDQSAATVADRPG
ncbi:MAG: ABC transporter substrate-binding protein, partial [Actinomycetota bacterium]|nr:ABC transporter substrate-binding protein [Actinomycetota bacterium]